MMFKTVIFSGFLFATVCITGAVKPNIATLEVQSNLDQSLVHKEFRVLYSGVGDGVASSSVSIKIYKKGGDDSQLICDFPVERTQTTKQKAYYFASDSVTEGEYEVAVCADDSNCSSKNPALTRVEANPQQGKIICENGDEVEENGKKKWVKQDSIILDVIGADNEDWIKKQDITELEKTINRINPDANYQSEMNKYEIKSNPSYDKSESLLYAGLMYDIAYYRALFMKKGVTNAKTPFAHPFCKRKYLLSYHVHVLDKITSEVIHRSKKTLYMSQGGKQYFIYTNDKSKSERRKVPVELTAERVSLEEGKQYQVRVSFCATEKDTNESTVCSDPVVKDLIIED